MILAESLAIYVFAPFNWKFVHFICSQCLDWNHVFTSANNFLISNQFISNCTLNGWLTITTRECLKVGIWRNPTGIHLLRHMCMYRMKFKIVLILFCRLKCTASLDRPPSDQTVCWRKMAWNQLSARIASLVQQHTLSFWISLSLSDWMSAELLLACDTKNWKAYEILFMLNLTVFTSQYHPATLIYPVASV